MQANGQGLTIGDDFHFRLRKGSICEHKCRRGKIGRASIYRTPKRASKEVAIFVFEFLSIIFAHPVTPPTLTTLGSY